MQESFKDQITRLQATLDQGRRSRDIVVIRNCQDEVSTLLENLVPAENYGPEETFGPRGLLLNIRGQAQLVRYDLGGQMRHLQGGVGDLSHAVGLVEGRVPEPFQFAIRANLAFATVRFGEQTNSRKVLSQALHHLTQLKGKWSLAEAPPDLHRIMLSYCLAKFRLGGVSGGRGLVKEACRDHAEFLRNPHLNPEVEQAVSNNSIVALFENARLHRDPGLFQSLIDYLEPKTRTLTPNLPFLLKNLANSYVEISKLLGRADGLEAALGNFETVATLLRRFAHSGPLFSVLQAQAAAHFQLGKCLEAEGANRSFAKAIETAQEALNLIRSKGSDDDARMTRILLDLGAYRFGLGVRSDDREILAKAMTSYESAQARANPEMSPSLAFKASLGIFQIRCFRREWDLALAAFERAEQAWRIAMSDRLLTFEIHDQMVIEMEGQYSRAAYCHLIRGQVTRAVETIESGRAQKMKVLSGQRDSTFSELAEVVRLELEEAQVDWEEQRRHGTDKDCERAWRVHANLLRRAGLAWAPSDTDLDAIRARLPCQSVIVYLFEGPSKLFAVLVDGADAEPTVITFPEDVVASVDRLLYGSGLNDQRSWRGGYRRFRQSHDAEEDTEEAFLKWSEVVENALELLGKSLMEKIHSELLDQNHPEGATVFLCPPGGFASLPLSWGRLNDGRYFGEVWNVSLVPNSSFIVGGQKETATEPSLLVIAGTQGQTSVRENLPFASREGELVGGHLPEVLKNRLQGSQASLSATLDGFCQASFIHVACHGSYEMRRAEASAIHLPSGSDLPIARLKPTRDFSLHARLVFLSCCESGISGRSIPPDEFLGLLPSFLQCGVQAGIGTLWPVYDDAALFFSLKFYRHLLNPDGSQSMEPAAALAATSSWLREVTVSELIGEGWLSAPDAWDLLQGRFATHALRIRPHGKNQTRQVTDRGKRQQKSLGREELEFRPYQSPVDWAAFILVGS